MSRTEIVEKLKTKPDVQDLIREIINQPKLIPVYFDIINHEKSSVKFLGEKALRGISEVDPELLYPYFSDIVALLDSDNSFIKWGGIITLSNLVVADHEKKFLKVYDNYFSMLDSQTMVTAANAAGNAWKIARKYPELEPDITKRLLSITDNTYYHKGEPSPECKNVLYGHIIECFDKYYQQSTCKKEMLAFVASQRNNPRKKVAKSAASFLKKYAQDAKLKDPDTNSN